MSKKSSRKTKKKDKRKKTAQYAPVSANAVELAADDEEAFRTGQPDNLDVPSSGQTLSELALNLADLGHTLNLAAPWPEAFCARLACICDDTAARFGRDTIDRIYVGSYFCDRFFLSLNDAFYQGIAQFCAQTHIALTLVVPVFGQSTLAAGRQRVAQLLAETTANAVWSDNASWPDGIIWPDDASWPDDTYASNGDEGYANAESYPLASKALFDEVVVNDPAMAQFVQEIISENTFLQDGAPASHLRVSLGRMMAKSPRDPRHAVLAATPQPYAFDAAQARAARDQFGYALAECDPTVPTVDATALEDALPIALHLPHCFMTTGHICEAASLHSPVNGKFRADMPCQQECLACVQVYEHHNYDTGDPLWFIRQGRTIYFENPDCEVKGATPQRIIWTPADFLCSNEQPLGTTYGNSFADQGRLTWE